MCCWWDLFLVLVDRDFNMHDVRVDQLVCLQCFLWDGNEVQRALRQAVPRGRLAVPAQHRGDREVCGQRRVLWVCVRVSFHFILCVFMTSHQDNSTSNTGLMIKIRFFFCFHVKTGVAIASWLQQQKEPLWTCLLSIPQFSNSTCSTLKQSQAELISQHAPGNEPEQLQVGCSSSWNGRVSSDCKKKSVSSHLQSDVHTNAQWDDAVL